MCIRDRLAVVWKRPRFTNVSCLWSQQQKRADIRLVALFVLRGYLAFLRPSRSSFILKCLQRGWSVSLLEYFVTNWWWFIVFKGWPFFLNERYYGKDLRTSPLQEHATEKRQDSIDPQRVNLFCEDSMCMVNWLVIPQGIVFFFLLHDRLASDVSEEKFCFVNRA